MLGPHPVAEAKRDRYVGVCPVAVAAWFDEDGSLRSDSTLSKWRRGESRVMRSTLRRKLEAAERPETVEQLEELLLQAETGPGKRWAWCCHVDASIEGCSNVEKGAIATVTPMPTPVPVPASSDATSPAVNDFADYRRDAVARHRDVRLAGFNERVRVRIDLDALYVDLDVVLDHGRADRMVYSDAEHAHAALSERARTQRIPFSKAFELAETVCGKRGLVLLGDPGSGKTTELKRVLLQILSEDAGRGPGSMGLPGGVLPVFLPLRNLEPGESLLAFMQRELEGDAVGSATGLAERLLERGDLLLLLDGLDEVADQAERRRVAKWIGKLYRERTDFRFVVSSRFAGYVPDVRLDDGFLEVRLRAMTSAQVRRFVQNWYKTVEAAEAELDRRIAALAGGAALDEGDAASDEGALLADFRVPEGEHEEASHLLTRFDDPSFRDAQLYALTTNPLLLTAICLVHRSQRGQGGDLPRNRAALLRECTSVLLKRWRTAGTDGPTLGPEDAQQVLQPVARWLHEEDGRTRATADELEAPVRAGLSRVEVSLSPGELLRRVRDESGLLTGWGMDRYGFMHLGFQEYLTAREIRWLATSESEAGVVRELAGRFGQTWWREVISLLLAGDEGGVLERFSRCLSELPEIERWTGSALMGRVFGQKTPEQLVRLDAVWWEHPSAGVRAWWRRLRGLEAVAGDVIVAPRGGVELVRIPAGRFLMGSPEDEEEREEDEVQHEVVLSEFYLARTPVTNTQYAEYLKANPEAKEPEYWGDDEYNQPEQPVVGVSWNEARAYCEWAGLRLPTEAQWEYACRAGTTTRYCSGDGEEDLKRVGWYYENSGGQLHAVGELEPNGFGLYDMHGNVCEWCLDAYARYEGTSPRAGDGLRREPVGDANRVMRGGDFDDEAQWARSASRIDYDPVFHNSVQGFRPAQVIP